MRLLSITTCLWAASVQGAALGKLAILMSTRWDLIASSGRFSRRDELANVLASRESLVNATGQTIEVAAAFPDGYWLNDMSGKGRAAFNNNPDGYKVFRNIRDYGAVGK
jgi:glucan 1,3-beta-glucosidase